MNKVKKTASRHAIDLFGASVKRKFSTAIDGREEDQLRRPVDELIESVGTVHKVKVIAKDESTLADRGGRPDFAIAVEGLLCGYIGNATLSLRLTRASSFMHHIRHLFLK